MRLKTEDESKSNGLTSANAFELIAAQLGGACCCVYAFPPEALIPGAQTRPGPAEQDRESY